MSLRFMNSRRNGHLLIESLETVNNLIIKCFAIDKDAFWHLKGNLLRFELLVGGTSSN